MVPVEKMRGPTILPAFCSSLAANTLVVSFDGSCIVVTPKVDIARLRAFCSGITPSSAWPAWAWTSTRPGITVLPVPSTTCAPAGITTEPRGPTARIRSRSHTTTPSSITSSPFMVTIRAPDSAVTPAGRASGCSNPSGVPGQVRGSAPSAGGTVASDSGAENRTGPVDQCTPFVEKCRKSPDSDDSFTTGTASLVGETSTARPVGTNAVT